MIFGEQVANRWKICIFIFFFYLGFTPRKAEQPCKAWSYKKKKHKKVKAFRESV